MSSERVITVGVTTVGVVVAVTMVLVAVVGVVTDCNIVIVTVAVSQIGFRFLFFKV